MEGWERNRKRGLAEVVSIDAWHERFGESCDRADLHANVTFMTGRLGGEPESQVRFRLSLKRAEIVVVIPETEPLSVDHLPSKCSAHPPDRHTLGQVGNLFGRQSLDFVHQTCFCT